LGGLFGVDEEKAKSQLGMSSSQIESFKKLGIIGKGTGFEERRKSITGFSETQFGKGPEEDLRKGRFFQQIFGTQSAGEALGFLTQLQNVKPGDLKAQKKFEEQLKEAGKSPEIKIQEDIKKRLEDLKGIDSDILKVEGEQALNLETLGSSLSETGVMIEGFLTSMDGALSELAGFFTGYKSTGIQNKELVSERDSDLQKGLKSAGIKDLSSMSATEAEGEMARVKSNLTSVTGNLKSWSPEYGGSQGMTVTNKSERASLLEQQGKLADALTAIEEHLGAIRETNSKTAKNTERKRAKTIREKTR
jgi:hypothetical protein